MHIQCDEQVTTRTYYKTIPEQTAKWTQPVLTGNGTLGGSSYACAESHFYSASNEGEERFWKMFNPSPSIGSDWQINSVSTSTWYYAIFYTPTPIRLSKWSWMSTQAVYNPQQVRLYGSNSNGSWTQIGQLTSIGTTDGTYYSVSLNANQQYWKYFKFEVLPRSTTAVLMTMLSIDAVTHVRDPYEITCSENEAERYEDKSGIKASTFVDSNGVCYISK